MIQVFETMNKKDFFPGVVRVFSYNFSTNRQQLNFYYTLCKSRTYNSMFIFLIVRLGSTIDSNDECESKVDSHSISSFGHTREICR